MMFWLLFFAAFCGGDCAVERRPNIIMIVADDLGWNDVSFHGSNQIPTPNIDRLASEGVVLNNYYVLPICTPTRAAILTGRYGIHTGMQSDTIYADNAWALGLNEKLLPQYLKGLGYRTHAVGKWHLGFYAEEFTPTRRGFDSFYGYYLGKSDYWDHSNLETYWGLDLHDNLEPVWTQWGNYSTEMYTATAERRIRDHNASEPLFLYLAYQAVHSANRPLDPIQAPAEWIDKFAYIKHEGRRKYAAVVAYLDYGIGRVYDALVQKGILDNTVIVFTTDNGGPANGFDFNWANNFPLRGVKATLWEGGVRGVGFVHSKLLQRPGRVSTELLHCTDWLPTLVSAAGGDLRNATDLDGVNAWPTISSGDPSPRQEVLLNIDPLAWKNAALRVQDWKIVQGQEPSYWSGWYPPPGTDQTNATSADSRVTDHLRFVGSAVVECGPVPASAAECGIGHGPCLFHIASDPCEYTDLSTKEPEIFQHMKNRLLWYKQKMVNPRNNDTSDPMSDPKLHGGVWVPWIKL